MLKRITALFTAFFILMSTTALAARKDLKESYGKNITIGLKNMLSNSIKITLNGVYTADGQVLSSGTSYTLDSLEGKINFNNKQYSEISFLPNSTAGTLTLTSGTRKYSFSGIITFRAKADGNILPLNSVDIESYLKGVVAYEMSNSYPIEALKAQTVAARNYALANIEKHRSEGFDLCDGTHCQVYRGYNSAYSNVNAAVDGTKGIILTYNDSLVSGFYSASNGGYVESSKNAWSSDIPYLQVRQDEFDNTDWPYGDRKFTTPQIDKTLKEKGILTEQDIFIRLNIDTIQKNESTRIASLEVVYTDAAGIELIKTITKERARTFLSLPSSLYNVTYDAAIDTYTFTGKGNGHGIGLSQIGAKNRALAGQKYDEILTFYYMGSQTKRVGDIIEGFSISKYDTFVGDTVTFTSKATASSNTLFKYTVELNNSIIFTRDYLNDPVTQYKVDRAGYLTVHLYTKDVNSNRDYDEHRTLSFTAINLLEITNVNFSTENVVVNKPVTISIDIQGASASGIEYRVEAEKDNIVFYSKTSDTSSFEFIPQLAGDYTIYAMIKEKGKSGNYNDMQALRMKVMTEAKPPAPPASAPAVQYSITRNLQKGVTGNDVKVLQEALKKLGFFSYGSITDYFGDVTKSAVVSFQSKSKLSATGIVDKNTAAAINAALIAKNSAPSQPTVPSTGTTPPAGGTTTPAFSMSRTLKVGISGNDVKQLQEALKKLGYFTYGSFTTYFGEVTKIAVVSFQSKSKLAATGIVDSSTAAAINSALLAKSSTPSQPAALPPSTGIQVFSASRTLKVGLSGDDVKQLQEVLKKLGYYTYPSITGYYGTVTADSVKAFQRANGMSQTGIVDAAVVKKINEKMK